MMLTALALLLTQPTGAAATTMVVDRFGPDRTGWLVGTVGHSEWCPAGNVRLDLATGRYAFTPTGRRPNCGLRDLQREVRTGTLNAAALAPLRAAAATAMDNGLETSPCPHTIIFNNGGPHMLVLTDGARTIWLPRELNCWSDAARNLDSLLNAAFPGG